MEREKDDPNNNINNDNNNVLTVMRSKDDDKLFAKEPVISLLPQKQEYGDFLETFETPNAPEKIEKIEFAKMSVGAREIEQAFNKDFQINRFNVYGRTVLLKKIPDCYRNETKLFNYIESLGLGKVESITVNRNYERLQKLVKERKNVVEKLETLYLKLAKQLLILVRLGFIFKAVCDEKNEVCAKNADGADGKKNNCVSHISLPIQEPKNHENATIAASKDYRKAQEELYIADETCGFNNIDEPNSYFVSNNFDNELRNQTRNDKKKLVDQLPETERLKQSLILLGWFLANEGTTAGRPGVKAVLKKYPYLVWDALLVLMENMYYYFTELKKDFKGAVEEVGLYQDPILCGEEPNSFNEDEQKHRIAIKERIRRIIGKDIRKQELDKEIFGNKGELQANDSENDELYILFYFFEYYGGNLRNNSLKHWDDIKNIREKLKRCDNEIKELRIEALKERVQSRDASETNLMHATESYNGKVQKSRWIYNVLFCRLVAKKKIDKSWLNSTDSAFVTFKSSTAAQIATQVLVSSGIKELTSEEAPKPNDVLWSGFLITNQKRKLRNLLVSTFVGFIIVIWLVPMGFLMELASLAKILESDQNFKNALISSPWIEKLIINNLPAILASASLVVVPYLLKLLTIVEAPYSKALQNDSVIVWHFVMLYLNVFIFFCVGPPVYNSFISWVGNPLSLLENLSRVIATSGNAFFANYVIFATVSHALELAQVGIPLIISLISDSQKHNLTPRKVHKFKQPWSFPAFYFLPPHCLIMVITFTYALISPIVVIAAVFYFGIGLLVYKQQFAYAYVESSGSVDMSSDLRNGISAHGDSLAGGRLWIHILHFASVGMITAVVVFSMMMIFKRSFVQAGLALPLLVIIIVFMKHLDRHWIPRIKLLPLEVIRGNETGIARKALENRILDKKIKHRSKTLMNFVSSKTLLSRKEHSKLFSRNKTTTSKLNLVSENPTKQLAHKNSTFEQCTCRRISGNSSIMGKYLQNIFHRTRKMLLHDENSLLVMNNACSSDKCRINRRTGFTKSEDCLPEQKKKYSNYNPKRCLLKKRANKRRPLSVCSVDLRNDVPFPKSKAEACDIINEIVAVTCSACNNSQYICDLHQNSQKLTKISPILSGFKVDMFKSNSKAPSVPKSTFNTDAGKEQLNTSENTKILDRGFPLDDKITYNSYLYPSNYENDDNNHSNDSNDVRYNLKKYSTISHKSDYEVQHLKRIGDISNLELPVPIEDPNSVKICDSNQNPSSDFNKNVIPKNNFVITNRNGISNFQKLYTEKSTAEENKFVSSYKHDLEKAAQCSDVGENRGIIKACSRIFGSAIYRPSLNGNSQHEKKHIWKSMSIDERYKITSKGFSKNNNANDFGSYYQSTDNIYAVLQKFTRKDEVGAQKAKGYQFMNVKSDTLDIKERVGAKNTNFNSQISIGGRGLGLMENSKKPADRRRLRNKRLNIFNCDCLPEEVEEGINIPQGFGDIMEEYTGEINFENNTEGSDSSTNSDDDLAREILIRDFDFSSNINPFSNLGKNICSDTNSDINYNSDAHEYPSGISDRLHEQDGYKGVRNSEFPNDLKINKRSHTSKQNRNSNKIKSRSEKDMNTSKAKNKHCRSCSRKVITNYDEAAHYQYLNPCLWEPLRTVLWLPQNPLRMTSDHLKCILYEFQ